ncbi:MAG: DUF188 domain-containing protein [Clostridiales bacterium]|nr:DUF188 domain-containing protein [Clostridiales bacterium]
MNLFIDADGCPVVKPAVQAAKRHKIACKLVCDTAHEFHLRREGVEVIVVSTGKDSVDYAIVNAVRAGDIVVTQDYGLAAMVLSKRALPITQNGLVIHDGNLDALLAQRHMAQKARRSGQRMRGPSKRTVQEDQVFARNLEQLILENLQR